MKLYFVCFTKQGAALTEKLAQSACQVGGHDCYLSSVHLAEGFEKIDSLSQWTENVFAKGGGLVFVGACGIAVRSIAPYLQDKTKDPAVVVIDETGHFSISLVSGHMGGANQLSSELAEYIGAVPVITTATDRYGLFAVDSFAKRQGLYMSSKDTAKAVSAALLAGREVGFDSQFPYFHLPKELTAKKGGELGVFLSIYENQFPYDKTLLLTPPIAALGIGCKRGTALEAIEGLVMPLLREKGISLKSIRGIASIDKKANEPGLLAFSQKYQWPFHTFSAAQLQNVKGSFTPSAFVQEQVGVDNVCERAAALLAGTDGKIVIQKTAAQGVTVALAVEKWSVDFAK